MDALPNLTTCAARVVEDFTEHFEMALVIELDPIGEDADQIIGAELVRGSVGHEVANVLALLRGYARGGVFNPSAQDSGVKEALTLSGKVLQVVPKP